ncbi:MAG TPA: glycerol-3-phosphate cytidylyltransferase [Lachnospiraceae bacterium]|nr:glycerol-3-phosphate cytidylyltransferase [Lachnospiraceae bacterium]
MKKYKVGYTQGVYDMFHIGHLNLLNNARDLCEHLIVGVNSDELVTQYKHKLPVIPEEERRLIVANIKAVDACEIVDTLDKVENYKRFHYDVVFIGDDWKGNARWTQTEKDLAPYGVDVVYLPHTKGVCSTELRKVEDMHVNE